MKKNQEEFSLSDFIAIFVPKLWIIVAIAIVFGAAFGGYTFFFTDDTYTSSVVLQVEKLPDDPNKSTTTSDLSFARNSLPTIKYILATEDFLDQIIDRLAINSVSDVTYHDLKSCVAFSAIEDTELLKIDVTTADKELSYKIAQAYSDLVPDKVMSLYDNVDVALRNTPREATVNSRGVVRNFILGVIAGAVLSAIVIFMYNLLDITIRDKKKIEDNFDIPVLGVIPKVDYSVSENGR